MPAGRPTKYRKEFCDVAEEFLSQGLSQAALAGELGVDEDTIKNWMDRHPAFFGAIKKGRAKGLKKWELLGLHGAEGKVDGFNAASWVFNMKNRFGWRDKQELMGEGGGPVVVNVVKHVSDADH